VARATAAMTSWEVRFIDPVKSDLGHPSGAKSPLSQGCSLGTIKVVPFQSRLSNKAIEKLDTN
jgi:hypothetical protein